MELTINKNKTANNSTFIFRMSKISVNILTLPILAGKQKRKANIFFKKLRGK